MIVNVKEKNKKGLIMTNRKRNINRVRRRQRAKMVRPSATSTSEKYTEEEDDLIANNMAEAVADISSMLLAITSLFLLFMFLHEINR